MTFVRRPLARAVLCALCALAPARLAWAQPMATHQSRAANLLVLEVRLDQQLLSDGMTAFQYGDDVYLPLGDLARLLTIAITTQPVEGRASGFVLNEARTFSLNVPERQVSLAGREEALDRSQFKLQQDDIYVASKLLSRWLPVDLDVDMSSLTLKLHARELLPLQARQARGTRRQAGAVADDPGYPHQATPYDLAGTPLIDQTVSLDVRSGHRPDPNYTAYMTGDLLGMQAALYANAGRHNAGQDVRLTLGRTDPDANLLGPLHARSALFGSVAVPGVSGVSFGSATGNGLAIGNRPLNQPSRFDRHTLQGDLPPGWDVELYFNNALVGFQAARPDGKYVFEDLPLVYGSNEFRLVFHGPLGQVRVERQSFLLEQSLVAPGTVYYNVARHTDEYGHLRSSAQFDLGLPGGLTASAGETRLTLAGADRRYTGAGLRQYLNSVIVGVDAVRADNGGTLAHTELKTGIGGLSIGAGHSVLARGFASEIFQPSNDPIRLRDEVRVDGLLPSSPGLVLPVSLAIQRDRLESDARNTQVDARVAAYRNGTAISNAVRWQSLGEYRHADGLLQMSRRVAGIGVTGQMQYAIRPVPGVTSLAVAIDKYLAEGYMLNVGVLRAFDLPHYDITAAINKSLGSFGLGLTARYSTQHEYGAGIQFFMALGREPRSGAWHTDAQPLAGNGAASIRVFVDKNLNGAMDSADEPVRGAGFTVNGGSQLARTDAAGIAYLSRLAADQQVDIALDSTTLEDPQWMPRQPGVRVVPRQGKVMRLEFPVIVTGEIDGTIWRLGANGARRGAGDLQLELVDSQRKVAARSASSSDGYFVFSNVPPGDYLLRISPDQLRRLHMHDLGMHLVTVSNDGNFVNGREFYVEPDATAAR
jgi:hypothetical protein